MAITNEQMKTMGYCLTTLKNQYQSMPAAVKQGYDSLWSKFTDSPSDASKYSVSELLEAKKMLAIGMIYANGSEVTTGGSLDERWAAAERFLMESNYSQTRNLRNSIKQAWQPQIVFGSQIRALGMDLAYTDAWHSTWKRFLADEIAKRPSILQANTQNCFLVAGADSTDESDTGQDFQGVKKQDNGAQWLKNSNFEHTIGKLSNCQGASQVVQPLDSSFSISQANAFCINQSALLTQAATAVSCGAAFDFINSASSINQQDEPKLFIAQRTF